MPRIARAAIATMGLALAVSGSPAAAQRAEIASPASALTAAQRTCVQQLTMDLPTSVRIGQLIWVGMYADNPRAVDPYLRTYRPGGVVLLGGFHNGVSVTASATAHAATFADSRVKMAIAADQEGGYVQQVQGSGFSTIPSAYYQGSHYSTATIQRLTASWAAQLRAAGVNVNLAPVADTVNKDFMPYNRPIGYYLRNYDYAPDRVSADVSAAVAGMHAGGIAATIKHFPGLGRITNNTDTSDTGITDTATSATSHYLNPFKAGIAAGGDFVMISNAKYSLIDAKRNAAFSPTIITGLLRGQLGYQGVVISDDIGNAVAVQTISPGDRAVRFINSGGDIILTANASDVPTMISAIRSARATNPNFKARLDAAVLRILTLKTQRGMTSCS